MSRLMCNKALRLAAMLFPFNKPTEVFLPHVFLNAAAEIPMYDASAQFTAR